MTSTHQIAQAPLDQVATQSSQQPSASRPTQSLAPYRSVRLPNSHMPPLRVRDALLSCDAVCFNVDSTMLTEEGINVLAAYLGKGSELAALTTAAMNDGVPFHTVLQQRLHLLQPSRDDIAACLATYPLTLTPGLLSLLHLLRERNKRLYLATGGFIQMIEHLLPTLGIPRYRVYANNLVFAPSGHFAGHDPSQPTSQAGGKARAIQSIFNTTIAHRRVVMVGSGITDVEARPPAICMVGYGGVVARKAVRAQADWFVTDWAELMDVFESAAERVMREERMARGEDEKESQAGQLFNQQPVQNMEQRQIQPVSRGKKKKMKAKESKKRQKVSSLHPRATIVAVNIVDDERRPNENSPLDNPEILEWYKLCPIPAQQQSAHATRVLHIALLTKLFKQHSASASSQFETRLIDWILSYLQPIHCCYAWTPIWKYVDDWASLPRDASKFCGLPYTLKGEERGVHCPCGTRMVFFLQLRGDDLPLPLRSLVPTRLRKPGCRPLLQAWMCPTCHYSGTFKFPHSDKAARWLDMSLAPSTESEQCSVWREEDEPRRYLIRGQREVALLGWKQASDIAGSRHSPPWYYDDANKRWYKGEPYQHDATDLDSYADGPHSLNTIRDVKVSGFPMWDVVTQPDGENMSYVPDCALCGRELELAVQVCDGHLYNKGWGPCLSTAFHVMCCPVHREQLSVYVSANDNGGGESLDEESGDNWEDHQNEVGDEVDESSLNERSGRHVLQTASLQPDAAQC